MVCFNEMGVNFGKLEVTKLPKGNLRETPSDVHIKLLPKNCQNQITFSRLSKLNPEKN